MTEGRQVRLACSQGPTTIHPWPGVAWQFARVDAGMIGGRAVALVIAALIALYRRYTLIAEG